MNNIISRLENKGLCSGCGSCAVVCPTNSIEIIDRAGVYRPKLKSDCSECGKCIRVCPFYNQSSDEIARDIYKEDNLRYNEYLGHYIGGYVGYSAQHREKSASGGLGTWFLEKLLTEGIVDCIACVGKKDDEDKLYEYKLVSSVQELRDSSRSAYYPVEMSEVLDEIRNSDKKYAVIGVPCFIRGIRKLQALDKRFKENIVITAGICCNSLPDKKMIDFMALLAGQKDRVKEITFRYKDNNSMTNHCTVLRFDDKTIKSFSHKDKIFSFPYYQKLFAQRSCSCCDDIFAECADVVFMDAWLKEYRESTEGFSVALTRTEKVDAIFRSALGEEIQELDAEQVLKSQVNVGVVRYKRDVIGGRLDYYTKVGYDLPHIRDKKGSKLVRRSYEIQEKYGAQIRRMAAQYINKPDNEKEDVLVVKKRIEKKLKRGHLYGATLRKMASILAKCGIKV